ncbi:D-alanyl-D-alanine carboxypeptidase family protein [Sinorhizobium sp. BG8]|uniref:D-alanyl-D-alanine carboxypeptidase family protein n=1 Tax=Sinorhizobium sp. BG8 TaxID=2613773 RepID=UPI00193E10AF|nr:D-alanyl-D-alanine carboxypeptidase family protein [Sinorhizobium sp. BG8]QRM55500.1 D-alanyl-D-alanine carboxypeptidase [Sinorhizobium sp. BG8]
MHRRFLVILSVLFAFAYVPSVAAQSKSAGPQQFEVKAKQIYMVEAETGTVLLARNEDEVVPAASLAKLMTMAVVFKALKSGDISIDTQYPVSEHAWRTGGAPSRASTMFAALKSNIRVQDLVRGVIVQLANDACIVLGEGMSGSEPAFAARMTKEARELGLRSSSFTNATGLPDPLMPGPVSMTSMRDLVDLARHLYAEYPDFYAYYAEPEFEWNKIRQRNKNPLLPLNIGADGLGTGFAEGYGYAIVASVNRDGKRIFLAMSGMESEKIRIEETRRVIEWAMSSFERRTLFKADEPIAEASVYGGDAPVVPLVAAEPVDVFLPVDNPEKLVARVVYVWPIRAPVSPGEEVGVLRIWNGGKLLREVPVKTAGTVSLGTLTTRAVDALQELLFFWL